MGKTKLDETYIFKTSIKIKFFWGIYLIYLLVFGSKFHFESSGYYLAESLFTSSLPRTVWFDFTVNHLEYKFGIVFSFRMRYFLYSPPFLFLPLCGLSSFSSWTIIYACLVLFLLLSYCVICFVVLLFVFGHMKQIRLYQSFS